MIKLTRSSDNKEFVIDGDSKEWKATKIEGIDALTLNVYTETPAIGVGEIVTGKHTGRRDISVTAHRSSLNGISQARSEIMEFFNPDDTYTMEISYNSRSFYIDCELLAYKLPTENIHRALDLTFTMLCPEPYFHTGNLEVKISQGMPFFTINGSLDVIPVFVINLYLETEIKIYIDDSEAPIHIILPDDFFPAQNPACTLELDCLYGLLTNQYTNYDLTRYIESGNTMPRLKPGRHYARFLSNTRPKESGTLKIQNYNTAGFQANSPIKELIITFPDGITITYTEPNTQYSHQVSDSSWGIRFADSLFIFNGPNGGSIDYTIIFEDPSPNRSKATLKYRELYRGF